jgi:hypothetical protein
MVCTVTRNLTPGKLSPENLIPEDSLPKSHSRRFAPAKTRSYENPLPKDRSREFHSQALLVNEEESVKEFQLI